MFQMNLRVISTFDAMFRLPDDVFQEEADGFLPSIRVFQTNDAMFSTNLRVFQAKDSMSPSNLRVFQAKESMFSSHHRVFRTNPSSFQARKEKSLSTHPLFPMNEDVGLRDQAVVPTTYFAFQP